MLGYNLGYILLDSVTLYIIMGMNGAMETKVSQAYGAGQLNLCGVYLNRAWLINTLIQVPLMFALLFSCLPLLEAMDQDSTVCSYAFKYVLMSLPRIYIYS